MFADPRVTFDTAVQPEQQIYPLKISTASIYSTTVYLQAKTFSGYTAYKKIEIEICNPVGFGSQSVLDYFFEFNMEPDWQVRADLKEVFTGRTERCVFNPVLI